MPSEVPMKCSQCDAGFPLYRNNTQGEVLADWRCEAHLDEPLPEDVMGVATDIQGAIEELSR